MPIDAECSDLYRLEVFTGHREYSISYSVKFNFNKRKSIRLKG